jgi:small subunit ribosomal protein S18
MADEIKDTNEKVKSSLSDTFDDSKITQDEEETVEHTKRRPRRRRRVVQNLKCPLCESGVGAKGVSYKDIYQLKKYTSVRGKIISTEKSGVCNKHQRQITKAIKRARYMALLPYSLDE